MGAARSDRRSETVTMGNLPPMTAATPWWDKERHADRRPLLNGRARIKSAIRAWFEAQGFIEVEPACLQVSPGNESHLHAFATDLVGTDLGCRRMYLHTSPEFAMKKLLAAGEPRIYAFAPVFRNRERGPLHAPEFTMLEWYRSGEPYERLWEDCAAIARIAADAAGRSIWTWRGRSCDVARPSGQTTVAQAFQDFAAIPIVETFTEGGADRDALAAHASAQGIKVADDDSWADIFSKVLTEKIEPSLGLHRLEFLTGYPIHEAALARPVPGNPALAERFELYCCGVELANGFGELNDPVAQRASLERQMRTRQAIYGERYPIDDDFIAALEHMPQASGCAMGFDRLVMLATGAERIEQVQWTPLREPGDA